MWTPVRHLAHGRHPPGADGLGERRTEMHPAMMSWWRARQDAYGAWSCGPGPRGWAGGHGGHGHGFSGRGGHGGGGDTDGDGEGFGAGTFGVRRPLRFLAYKLELDER